MSGFDGIDIRSALDHARGYVTRGWWVFPAPPGTKKSYLSKEYNGGERWGATNNLAQAEAYWEWYPEANVGLPTGEASGFFVVEADTVEGHGVDGISALERQQARAAWCWRRLPRSRVLAFIGGSTRARRSLTRQIGFSI